MSSAGFLRNQNKPSVNVYTSWRGNTAGRVYFLFFYTGYTVKICTYKNKDPVATESFLNDVGKLIC